MKTIKVFVDGQEGTTGLKIHERLSQRDDVELIAIDPERRKDLSERARLINQADAVILCLPDDAARESVSLVTNPAVRVLDASTAHRTHPDWVYGLPELSLNQRQRLKNAKRVAVPGCHATAFLLGLSPLVQAGIVPPDYPVVAYSLTGYTGGGKKLIAKYEDPMANQAYLNGPQHYALGLNHKHLPEMAALAGLKAQPIFLPVVGNFPQGMALSISLYQNLLAKPMAAAAIHEVLAAHYQGSHFIRVLPLADEGLLDGGYLDPQACNDTNRADVLVFGRDDRTVVVVRLDNLGKGASGAAVQCLNVMFDRPEDLGLRV